VDFSLALALIGLAFTLVFGVGGVVVTIVLYRRANPKRQLDWWMDSSPLVAAPGHDINDLSVKIKGVEVENPYLNKLTLVSNSRADIPSSAFDAGRPISVEVTRGGAVLLSGTETKGAIKLAGGAGEGDWAKFTFDPQLIRKGARGRLVFVSAGLPAFMVDSPLIDIALKEVPTAGASGRLTTGRRVQWAAVLTALLSANIALVFALLAIIQGGSAF